MATEEVYYVDLVQAAGNTQRKVPVPKKFWDDFPIGSWAKLELLENSGLFIVGIVQSQGAKQRRISVPHKFWDVFAVDAKVKISLVRKDVD